MLAGFLLPQSSLNGNASEYLYLHSKYFQKGAVQFSFLSQPWKCSSKLYKVPLRRETQGHELGCVSTKGQSKLHDCYKESDVSFGVSAPENFPRSKTMLDSSSSSMDEMNDFERQLHEFFIEIKNMVRMGNVDGAIDLLQANYEAVKEQIDAGAKGMEQAAMLDVIALGYMGVGDLKFVGSLLKMMREIVVGIQNDGLLLDSILMHMGSMYTTLGKFQDAMFVYRRGLEILESLFGKHSPFLITPLLGTAKVFGLIGRAMKAIEVYNRAISILEMSRGGDSEELVIPLFGLGNLFIKEGRAADAQDSFNRILTIYTKLYGEKDGRVGMAMCSLAHSMLAEGNLNEAIRVYKDGLRIIKDSKYMDLDDDVLERMRIDLAELLHVAGREHEGRELLEECLLITERSKGNGHPSSVIHLLNLATSYSRSKKFAEAERLLRTSLRIISREAGPEDQSITDPMLHLAITLYHLKHDEEAESLALEAVRIREDAFGKHSLPVGEALDCLVSIQTKLGRDVDDLLAKLKRVLSIQERELGNESEEVMVTLKKIIFYLDKLGKEDEKLPLQRRLSLLRTKYKQKVYA